MAALPTPPTVANLQGQRWGDQGADPATDAIRCGNRVVEEPLGVDRSGKGTPSHVIRAPSLGLQVTRCGGGHQAQRTNSAMAQSNRLPTTQPCRAWSGPDRPRRAPQPSGQDHRHGPRSPGQAPGAGLVKRGWKAMETGPWCGELSPQNCRQLRKASAAPVLSVPQPPAIASPARGPADPCPHHRGQRRRALSGSAARHCTAAAHCDPRRPPWTN